MSDTMLHSILQMPPELWTNDPIDIAQRHGRYLEASKRIAKLKLERDDARKEWDVARDGWSKALEERDEARRERDEAMQMLGEQLYQRVNEWTEEVERLLGELNAAREEVIELKAEREAYSMNRRKHDQR